MPLNAGQTLQNRYRIVSLLGQGGMGAVYRAWDTRLKVPVALKEMTPQLGLDPHTLAQLRQQFEQEAVTLARLKHNHLVSVTDFFEEKGNSYLVMEFVAGGSLSERIEREGALPEPEILKWADQLLDALAYCHSQGIIHRDVKPQNIVITPEGRAVLVDFGLVKLWDPNDPRTRTVMRGMGTPEYAPPEQYDTTGHTDPRSDVYGLGATIYHALTGQSPATATQRIASRNAFQPPRALNKSISPATEAAVLRALELTVEDRFPTAGDMAAALSSRVIAHKQKVATHSASPRQQHTKVLPGRQPVPMLRKRTPRWMWALAAVLVLVLAAGIWWISSVPRTTQPTTPPETLDAATTATQSPIKTSSDTILFTSDRDGKQEIYHLTGTGAVERITHTPGNGESWSPTLMPDGTILFTSGRDGKREIYHLTGTGAVERITHTPGDGASWSPTSTPDGTILFTSDRDGKREIYHLIGTGAVERITHTPGDGASWSPASMPDGAILFTSDRDGKREIYHLTGTGTVERITHTPGDGASWSPTSTPDGTILFTSDRDGKREIYHLIGTGAVERITHTPGDGASWSPTSMPDGTILFTSDRDGKREIYHLTGTGTVERTTHTPSDGESWLTSW